MVHQKGLVLVISGPSGTGKGSIIKPYMKENPLCRYSVSITTRKPRSEDKNGITYHFKAKEEVEELIRDDGLLEWDSYCGNYYGTPSKFVYDSIAEGYDCILELTVPGALNIRKKIPECVMIFIAPPSIDELQRRIVGRGTEDPHTIEKRMSKSMNELEMIKHYDYVIVNRDVNVAISELSAIVQAEKVKYERSREVLNELGLIQEE